MRIEREPMKPTLLPGDRAIIGQIVGRVNVYTPDDEVRAILRRKLRKVKDPELLEAAIAEGIRQHHANLEFFIKMRF